MEIKESVFNNAIPSSFDLGLKLAMVDADENEKKRFLLSREILVGSKLLLNRLLELGVIESAPDGVSEAEVIISNPNNLCENRIPEATHQLLEIQTRLLELITGAVIASNNVFIHAVYQNLMSQLKAISDMNQKLDTIAVNTSDLVVQFKELRNSIERDLQKLIHSAQYEDKCKAAALDKSARESFRNAINGSQKNRQKSLEDARRDLESATKLDRQQYLYWLSLAEILDALGNWNESIDAYGEAIRHSETKNQKSTVFAYQCIAAIQIKTESYGKAIETIDDTILYVEGNHSESDRGLLNKLQFELACCHAKEGSEGDSVRMLRSLLSDDFAYWTQATSELYQYPKIDDLLKSSLESRLDGVTGSAMDEVKKLLFARAFLHCISDQEADGLFNELKDKLRTFVNFKCNIMNVTQNNIEQTASNFLALEERSISQHFGNIIFNQLHDEIYRDIDNYDFPKTLNIYPEEVDYDFYENSSYDDDEDGSAPYDDGPYDDDENTITTNKPNMQDCFESGFDVPSIENEYGINTERRPYSFSIAGSYELDFSSEDIEALRTKAKAHLQNLNPDVSNFNELEDVCNYFEMQKDEFRSGENQVLEKLWIDLARKSVIPLLAEKIRNEVEIIDQVDAEIEKEKENKEIEKHIHRMQWLWWAAPIVLVVVYLVMWDSFANGLWRMTWSALSIILYLVLIVTNNFYTNSDSIYDAIVPLIFAWTPVVLIVAASALDTWYVDVSVLLLMFVPVWISYKERFE